MSASHTKTRWLLVLPIILLPCVIFFYYTSIWDAHYAEVMLRNSIYERLSNVNDQQMPNQQAQATFHSSAGSANREITHLVSPDAQIFANNTNYTVVSVQLPTAFHFLPHLLNDPNSLRPAYVHSKGRKGVSMVLGIPTVKRDKQSYFLATLKNLFDHMNVEETADTLIVVFVAETEIDYINYIVKQIEDQFPREFESGVIDVIAPHPSFYPDFTQIRDTLGDSHQRVVWRSKQNLDFAFLMSYAQDKGMFYVQLEDDILTKQNFITTMKSFALSQEVSLKRNWFVLDFCQLGFIGKLFKSTDLPWLVQYFIMFYNDKPVDWLMDLLISAKACSFDMDQQHCKMATAELWLHYEPSQFQHVGVHSSLKGKRQELKDKQFGETPLYYPHHNPEAVVESQIEAYSEQFTLYKAYAGDTFFWGLLPQPGNHLTFKFAHPIFIKRYSFRSGNAENPSDKFYNTTVEVLPQLSDGIDKMNNNVTEDGYIIIGNFDSFGVAQGTVDKILGKISVLRLTVHSKSDNWAILSEMHIEEDSAS